MSDFTLDFKVDASQLNALNNALDKTATSAKTSAAELSKVGKETAMKAAETEATGLITRLRALASQSVQTASQHAALAKSADGVASSFSGVAKSFNPIAMGAGLLTTAISALSFGAIANMVSGVIHARAELNNMSTTTGISVEMLSGLKSVADQSGTSMETVTGAILKFQKALGESQTATSSQSRALKALGLDAKDLGGDDGIVKVAKALGGFRDGLEKNLVMMSLFGKSGAEMNEFMQDLAEQGAANIKLTKAQTEQAEAYERSVRTLGRTMGQYKNILADGLLPVMSDVVKMFLGIGTETGRLDSAQKQLMTNKVTEWAKDMALGFASFADAVVTTAGVIEGIAKTITMLGITMIAAGDIMGKLNPLNKGGFLNGDNRKAAGLIQEQLVQQYEDYKQSMDSAYDKVFGEGYRSKLEKQFAKGPSTPTAAAPNKPTLPNVGGDGGAASAKHAYEAEMAALKAANDKLKAEFDIAQDQLKITLETRTITYEEYVKHEYAIKQAEVDAELVNIRKMMDLAKGRGEEGAKEYQQLLGQQEQYLLKKKQFQVQETLDLAKHYSDIATIMTEYYHKTTGMNDTRRNDALFDAKTMGMSPNEVALARKNKEITDQYMQAQRDAERQLREKGVTPQNSPNEYANLDQQTKSSIDEAQRIEKQSLADRLEYQKEWSNGAKEAWNEYAEKAADVAGQTKELFNRSFDSMGDMVANFVTTGKMDFRGFAASVIADLAKMLAKMAVVNAAKWAMSMWAEGGSFDAGVQKMATGEVVNGPRMFKFAGGTGMMGDEGAEAVMPLKRLSNGNLGVESSGGGGGQVITVAPQITVQVGSVDSDERANEMAVKIKEIVNSETTRTVYDMMRPGGPLATVRR